MSLLERPSSPTSSSSRELRTTSMSRETAEAVAAAEVAVVALAEVAVASPRVATEAADSSS
jgi:hypothetical protein